MKISTRIFHQKKINTRRRKLSKMEPVVLMARGHSGTRVLAWIFHLLNIPMWSDQSRRSGDTDRSLSGKIKNIVKKDTFITADGKYDPLSRLNFENAVHRFHQKLGEPQSHWGWKFPETYLMAPLVYDVFPAARFIHMVRDGRDIAFKNHLTDDPSRKVGKKILTRLNALTKPDHIQTAMSWKFQVDSFDKFKKKIPTEQLYELNFENLCTEPQKVVDEICIFLDVSSTKACEDFCDNEIDTSKIKQHKENDHAKILQVEKLIGATLLRHNYDLYGYEK